MLICGRGHHIDGPGDRLTNGSCRHCHREDLRTHGARRTMAMSILKQIERAGIHASDLKGTDGYALALKWLTSADDSEMARLEREHPAMIQKVMRQMERKESE